MINPRVFFARWSTRAGGPENSPNRFATWKAAAKDAAVLRERGLKASVYCHDDDGLHLYRELNRGGAWVEPGLKLKPLKLARKGAE